METIIVIPAADVTENSYELLKRLLNSITVNNIPNEVVVCFDGCREEFVEHFALNYNINPLVNRGNRKNFAGNSNMGLKYARDNNKHVLLVNQDCVLPDLKSFENIYGEGLVSATQVKLSGDILGELNKLNNTEFAKQSHYKVTGFCLFINNTVLNTVGFLDEVNFPASMDDDDYCLRTLLAKLPVETVNVHVHHEISACGAYTDETLGINYPKFKKKYGIPEEIAHADCNKWVLDREAGTLNETN